MKRVIPLFLFFTLVMVIATACKAEGSHQPEVKESTSDKAGTAEEKKDNTVTEEVKQDQTIPASEATEKTELQPEGPTPAADSTSATEPSSATVDLSSTTEPTPASIDSAATEPSPAIVDSSSATEPSSDSITGSWYSGDISGTYQSDTGLYDGLTGMGLIYTFREDLTFTQVVGFGSYFLTQGSYRLEEGVLTLTDRISLESADGGVSWGKQESLPDTSAYYEVGADASGAYLLLGEEGAGLPLTPAVNAMKLKTMNDTALP